MNLFKISLCCLLLHKVSPLFLQFFHFRSHTCDICLQFTVYLETLDDLLFDHVQLVKGTHQVLEDGQLLVIGQSLSHGLRCVSSEDLVNFLTIAMWAEMVSTKGEPE